MYFSTANATSVRGLKNIYIRLLLKIKMPSYATACDVDSHYMRDILNTDPEKIAGFQQEPEYVLEPEPNFPGDGNVANEQLFRQPPLKFSLFFDDQCLLLINTFLIRSDLLCLGQELDPRQQQYSVPRYFKSDPQHLIK